MVSPGLDMLEDSLVKKLDILSRIEDENDKQKEILSNSEAVDEAAFDDTTTKKGELIDKLILLDEGFQTLFDKVKGEIDSNKDAYADQIKRMQELIHDITDKSASIEAAEHRNKKLAEKYFSSARQKMNQSRQSSAAAFNYYQTMNNFKDIPPQFMDKKN